MHRRVVPEPHHFVPRISQVWIDPDNPAQLCDLHPAWSHTHPAPARFRRSDYGARPTGSLAEGARRDLGEILARTPEGPVRMSQVRRWGWLFNPITFFFVWDPPSEPEVTVGSPVGVVLEVTNTPWKERMRYPLILDQVDQGLTARFDKAMHVSPFLGMDHHYQITVRDHGHALAVTLDVVDLDDHRILQTQLRLRRRRATRRLLGASIRSEPFPTHRVSAGIHRQAVRLWAKGVPVVAHRAKTSIPSDREAGR